METARVKPHKVIANHRLRGKLHTSVSPRVAVSDRTDVTAGTTVLKPEPQRTHYFQLFQM